MASAIEEKSKRDNEPATSILRRFNRKLRDTGLLKRARSLRFHKRPISALKKKEEAMKRVKKQKRAEYLWKLGKTPKRTGRTNRR